MFDRSVRGTFTRWVTASVVATFAVGAALAVPAAATTTKAAPKAATTCADPSGKVKIGISYFGNVGAAVGAIGGDSSQVPADQLVIDAYQKGIDALNAKGGLAGCQVSLTTYNFQASAPDFNSESQKECVAFTQDTHVVAVYSGAYETRVAADCYAKAKVPFFTNGNNYPPQCSELKKYSGYLYFPVGVASCRFGSMIDLWNKAGLFPKTGAKVGILAGDDGTGQDTYTVKKVYGPALKKLNIPYETFTYHGSTSTTDFANTNTTMGAAILKFKTDGVNVVIFTPLGGQATAALLPQAANQQFFPAYGMNSQDALLTAAGFGKTAIQKGIGISWLVSDLPVTAQQALTPTAAMTDCATQTPASVGVTTGVNPLCDFFNLLYAGFKGQPNTSAASLKKGIDALGTTFQASTTYGGATKYGPGLDGGGASMAQLLKFDPSTSSWVAIKANQKAVPIP